MKNAKFSQRYKPHLKLLIKQLNLHLQPMTSLKERKLLVATANCKSKKDIDDLLGELYSDKNMDPMCRCIRLALATAAELWSSRKLLKSDHNESWFRTHVYLAV
jgi:hypothetical protein